MEKFKVTEQNLKEKTTLVYVYHAKSTRHAIQQVANRHGNPHYTKPELVFNRGNDEACSQSAWYTAERVSA
jgi:hypothetical protein